MVCMIDCVMQCILGATLSTGDLQDLQGIEKIAILGLQTLTTRDFATPSEFLSGICTTLIGNNSY